MKRVVFVTLALIIVSAAGVLAQRSQPATPGTSSANAGAGNFPPPRVPNVVLYDQTATPGVNSIVSQEFGAGNAAFSSEAADDFDVDAADGWIVQQVNNIGVYFNGPGPYISLNIDFYADNSGLPGGAPVCSYTGLVGNNSPDASLSVDLPTSCFLPSGLHWVMIQARQDFATGQYGWTESTVQFNNPSAWRNPGNGFVTPCSDWGQRVATCDVGGDPDLLFQLVGEIAEPAPTVPWAAYALLFVLLAVIGQVAVRRWV